MERENVRGSGTAGIGAGEHDTFTRESGLGGERVIETYPAIVFVFRRRCLN
jgi:hypothetical protein